MARIGLLGELRGELPSNIPYKRSKGVQIHRMGEHDVGVYLSGIGQKKAERSTELLCSDFKPEYLIFLGFCGAVSPELPIGTLLLANAVHYKEDVESLVSPAMETVKENLEKFSIDHRVGAFETFDKPVLARNQARDGVLGVDMEAYAIVMKAREYGVPPVILKSVSDILPEEKHRVLPTARLLVNVLLNYRTAKSSLNAFGKAHFPSEEP